ncbi:MAG: HNH endonuclease [Candidatus Saccharimonadales bacterium]
MKLIDFFRDQIDKPETGFFIIDSGNYEKDDDYVTYAWYRHSNNKIKAGDVFIYRKPQKLSADGKFYLYGAGQFEKLVGEDAVTGYITNAHQFKSPIKQVDLEDFQWHWKERGRSWEHYWGQYGINKITKSDFINILELLNDETHDMVEDQKVIEYDIQIAEGDFFVDDDTSTVKTRPWQRAWSQRVKDNYGFKCAMCDMSTPGFLIGSHIKPVSIDKDNRMNPSNGLCLCVLHDKAFDQGYITVQDNGVIVMSPLIEKDIRLKNMLGDITKNKINKPMNYKIDNDFLTYHRVNIFKR